jgi:hypothetical protein
MSHLRKILFAGTITAQLFGWNGSGVLCGENEGIPDSLNGKYRVISYATNNSACDAEGEHYMGYENTVVKLLADKNLTVPSGQTLSVFNCSGESNSVCGNYWSEWYFDTKNSDGSWSNENLPSISKGFDPNTCGMLHTVKKVSRSGNNVIFESRSYSNPPFESIPVSADKSACDDLGLVKKHKNQLTKCELYSRAVLEPLV